MSSGADETVREKCRGIGTLNRNIFTAQEIVIVTAERKGGGLLAKQGEFRGEQELLLRGTLEAFERMERGKNEWSEDAGSTGT